MTNKIDLQKIADELEFDLEDVEMLVDVFLESANENLESIKKAIDMEDYSAMFQATHAIKGSAANMLLDNISSIAQEMEANSRVSKVFDYQASYEQLMSSIEELKK